VQWIAVIIHKTEAHVNEFLNSEEEKEFINALVLERKRYHKS